MIAPGSEGEEPINVSNPTEPLSFSRFDECLVIGNIYYHVWAGESFNFGDLAPHRAVPSAAGSVYEVDYLSYIGGCGLLIEVSVFVSNLGHFVERFFDSFVILGFDFLRNYFQFFFGQHLQRAILQSGR